MKVKHLQITGMLMLVMLGTACRKDQATIDSNRNLTAVKFSSSIDGQVKTKAADNSWSANDNIGVFMKTGTGLTNVIAANKTYLTTGDGTFAPATADQTLYYPENGSSVDFIAYYPYQQTLNSNKYPVNVSNQATPATIDLMYANNATGLSKSSINANLVFTHQLAKVEFTVKNGAGVANLNGLTSTISALKTNADFDLATGVLTAQDQTADIPLKVSVKNGATIAEAILIPTTNETGTKVIFSVGGKTFTWKMPTNTLFEKGKKYTYEIELKTEGTTGTAITANSTINNWTDVPSGTHSLDQETVTTTPVSSSYMETPTIATNENTVYVAHGFPGRTNVRNYAMLYDKKYKVAYWVAYPMHSSYIGGSGRTDAWGYDPAIAQADQVNLSSSFGNGYDRGHQIPSGDRTATRELNATTFYYSNMTAQVSSMNQGIWNNLEQQVRTWTAQSDTLYVVTGAAIQSKTDQTITYSKGSAIPKYYYKALAMKKGSSYYTIAFKINNEIIPSGSSYNSFRMNVSDLEQETGYTFFPQLPNVSKTSIDNNIWK